MSDKTVFNQDLVLNKLVVSNSTDSSASGYVPQSTTITPAGITSAAVSTSEVVLTATGFADVTLTNANGSVYTPDTLNVNGSITTNNGVSVGTVLTIQNGAGSPNAVSLTCQQDNVLSVAGSVIASNIELVSQAGGNVNLTTPSFGTLEVGGNIQATGSVTSDNLTLIGGANSVILTASSTAVNTLQVPGNMTVGDSITFLNNFSFISSPTFSGGVASARFTPPTPGAWDCGPGTVTPIVLPPFYFNPVTSVLNCPYFFTIQTSNNVTVSVASYSMAQVNFEVTITLQVANLQAAGGAVVSISVLTFNPSVF
jgi:hypothetical protein